MQIPKANNLYNTGVVTNVAVSYINSNNVMEAEITIDGQTVTVDRTATRYVAGAGYDADTVAWALTGGGIKTATGEKILVIKVPVTLQTVISNVDTGFTLSIKNAAGKPIS